MVPNPEKETCDEAFFLPTSDGSSVVITCDALPGHESYHFSFRPDDLDEQEAMIVWPIEQDEDELA